MALVTEPVEVLLTSLDQKTGAAATAPGRLTVAENIEFDKVGTLSKRQGYRLLPTAQANDTLLPAVWSRLVLDGDELLVCTRTRAWAMADVTETLQGAGHSMVLRGVIGSGNISVMDVVTSPDVDVS